MLACLVEQAWQGLKSQAESNGVLARRCNQAVRTPVEQRIYALLIRYVEHTNSLLPHLVTAHLQNVDAKRSCVRAHVLPAGKAEAPVQREEWMTKPMASSLLAGKREAAEAKAAEAAAAEEEERRKKVRTGCAVGQGARRWGLYVWWGRPTRERAYADAHMRLCTHTHKCTCTHAHILKLQHSGTCTHMAFHACLYSSICARQPEAWTRTKLGML